MKILTVKFIFPGVCQRALRHQLTKVAWAWSHNQSQEHWRHQSFRRRLPGGQTSDVPNCHRGMGKGNNATGGWLDVGRELSLQGIEAFRICYGWPSLSEAPWVPQVNLKRTHKKIINFWLQLENGLKNQIYYKVWGEWMRTVWQLITPHVDIVTKIGEVLQNPEIISNCLIYSKCM